MPGTGGFDRFLFIVGAPRCGTTSLSFFLKENAAIAFPFVKEPHYFAQHDLRTLSQPDLCRRIEEEYLKRFFRSDPGRRVGADASVTYLYAPEQLEPVLRLWPESRFVVALRDPMTMLPSLHRRLIYIGDETIPSFEDAWAAVPDRVAGRNIPRRCIDPRWLRYDEAARFGTYVERLFAAVGRERCLVLLFDDLADDPAGQYLRLMDFAGLDPTPGIDLTARRAGKTVRFRWLQRLLKRPPNLMKEYLAGELFWRRLQDPGTKRERRTTATILAWRKQLIRWNQVSSPPERLSPGLESEIRRRFAPEVEHLGRLIDRDLSHWLRPRCDVEIGFERGASVPAPALQAAMPGKTALRG